MQKGFAAIIYLVLLSVAILVLGYFLVAKPYKVSGSDVKPPFVKGQLVLTEKISYFFNDPKVGDRVVFSPQTTNAVFIGTITEINVQGNVTSYKVLAAAYTARNLWEISKDKIIGKVYYPILTNEEVLKVLPTPFPAPAPTSVTESTNSAETTSLDSVGANWQTYYSSLFNFELKYPPAWSYKESKGTFYGDEEYKADIVDFSEQDNVASRENRIVNILRVYIITGQSLSDLDLQTFRGISSLRPTWNDILVGQNINAKSVSHSGCLSGDCYDVLFKKANSIFDLSISEQAHQGIRLVTFNQILSTFKFTN